MDLEKNKQRIEILAAEVEELKNNGGGGTTTNYNDLTNKPSINNQVLTGNKSLSDIGAATPSDITEAFAPQGITIAEGGTFPSGSRALLTEHKPIMVNDDQYYFLEETGVDYLYGSMPTSGAFPSLSYFRVMKSSFAVEFHNTAIETTPTENSANLITSGGVYTALQSAGGGLTPTYFGTAVPSTLSDEQYAIIQKHLPISTGSTEATATTVFSFLGEDNNSYWYGYTTGNSSSRIIYQTLLYISKSNNYTFTWSRSELYTNANAAKEICDTNVAKEISANANLDGSITPGIFYANETRAATLTNCPTTDAFKLFVDNCYLSNTRLIQRLYTCSAIPVVYIRTRNSGTWNSWYKFEGTAIT